MRNPLQLSKRRKPLLRLLSERHRRLASIIPTQREHFDPCSREIVSAKSWISLEFKLARGGNTIDGEIALHEASRLLNSGFEPSNCSALAHPIRISTDLGIQTYCLQLQSYVIKHGFVSNVAVSNALMRFYKRIDSLDGAHKLFDEIPEPSVISWNSLISGCVGSGNFSGGLDFFLELERSGIQANAFSLTAALTACGQLGFLELGRSVHAKIVKFGLEDVNVVANCLIDMYGKCCCVDEAIRIFQILDARDVISWNSVIASCTRNGELESALCFFNRMPHHDTISYNEIINGIAQFGDIDDAIRILSSMKNTNSSSWNSILTGLVNRGQAREALNFFSVMHAKGVEMDEYTLSVVLSGVTSTADRTRGLLIHSCAIKRSLDSLVVVGSALIDMYAKCGRAEDAESVFQTLPRKNLITWNTMISGYAHNGEPMKAIQLYEQLKLVRGLKPDWLTFLNILAACSHSGIELRKAFHYFESMTNEYGIKPSVEHCCSIIRLMGQKGDVRAAQRMIKELGFSSYGVVWRALLGACGTCGDLKVAKATAAKLIGLGGDDDDYVYVMLSNVYASYGKWREASTVRKVMGGKGVRKETGCSWIPV